uniref:Reverse transcriptase domain-containing protein n=1 Tax=Scleropages formosus TaxID=113540 RepID=A0A8C9U8A3_SCLFO
MLTRQLCSPPWCMPNSKTIELPPDTCLLQYADNLLISSSTAKTVIVYNALATAPALGLPDYKKPFHLYVHEAGGTAAGILAQEHGGSYRPVAYLLKILDPVDAERIVLPHPLTLHTTH